jgi:hypothetical protein
MGVRLYNSRTGRFLSNDPIPGGNANSYIYSFDPVNQRDLDGRKGGTFSSGLAACNLHPQGTACAAWKRHNQAVAAALARQRCSVFCWATLGVLAALATVVCVAFCGEGAAAVGTFFAESQVGAVLGVLDHGIPYSWLALAARIAADIRWFLGRPR